MKSRIDRDFYNQWKPESIEWVLRSSAELLNSTHSLANRQDSNLEPLFACANA